MCRHLQHIHRCEVMLGQGSNLWSMDLMAAGDSAPEMDFVDEAMHDQSFSAGTTVLQAQYLDY